MRSSFGDKIKNILLDSMCVHLPISHPPQGLMPVYLDCTYGHLSLSLTPPPPSMPHAWIFTSKSYLWISSYTPSPLKTLHLHIVIVPVDIFHYPTPSRPDAYAFRYYLWSSSSLLLWPWLWKRAISLRTTWACLSLSMFNKPPTPILVMNLSSPL